MGEVDNFLMPETAPDEPVAAELFDAGLPTSIDAERSILGAVLLDNAAFNEAAEVLVAEDFALDSHRKIYSCISDLIDDGRVVDIVTLVEELNKRKLTSTVGGVAYLASLTEGLPRRISIAEYVRIAKDKSLLRQAIGIFSDGLTRSADQAETATSIVEDVEARLLEIVHEIKTGRLTTIADSMREAGGLQPYMDKFTTPALRGGLLTHFADFDEKTGGLKKKELIIVAARPSMGKTAWAINVATNAAIEAGMVVAVFSLEMSRDALERRMVASVGFVDVRRATTAGEYLSEGEKEKMVRALHALCGEEGKVFIDDSPSLTPMQMRAKARRLKQREGRLDLVVVDYLQLMQAGKRTGNRQEEVASISRSLKAMAKELDVPVVALAQISRSSEQRQDKRPTLADLRESGQIEADADLVVFIHRDSYYNPDDEDSQGLADVIIAKQRDGPTGVVKMSYIDKITRFGNLAHRGDF